MSRAIESKDGETLEIPVKATFRGLPFPAGILSYIGFANNDLNPHFTLSPQGVKIKVLSTTEKSFDLIRVVGVSRNAGSWNINFVFKDDFMSASAAVKEVEAQRVGSYLKKYQVPLHASFEALLAKGTK